MSLDSLLDITLLDDGVDEAQVAGELKIISKSF